MGNELEHIYQTYLSKKQNDIHYIGESSGVIKLRDIFKTLVPSEHPDAYAMLDNEVLIFEHFEFDSSNNNKKKGSQQRRSEAEDSRTFATLKPSGNGTLHHGEIFADYSIENYKKNLKQAFHKHYSEIAAYKQTLREKGVITGTERITTLFFIEDTTVLGNIVEPEYSDRALEPLVLLFCDFFLDLFECSPDLDMVVCASWFPNEYCLWYMDQTMILEYRKHEIDTSKVKIVNLNPQSIGVKLIIPDERLFERNESV